MKVILLHGIAGSGKSTLIKHLCKFKRYNVISKDDFRMIGGNYKFDKEYEGIVEYNFFKSLDYYLTLNQDIIIDNTHLNQEFREKVINRLGSVKHIILSISPSDNPEDHVKNNIHGLTIEEIKKQISIYQPPSNSFVFSMNDIRKWETIELIYFSILSSGIYKT